MIPIKKRKRKVRLVISVLILAGFILATLKSETAVLAKESDWYKERLEFDEEGTLWMTTHDKKATGDVSYVTLGWTLKRENKKIGKTDSVRVKLEQYQDSKDDPAKKGYVFSYFRIGKEEIYSRIAEQNPAWAEELYRNGGMIYLDAIMTVKDSGKCRGSMSYDGTFTKNVYDTKEGIMGAETWAAPEALASHYDKAVYFPGNPSFLDRNPKEVVEVEKVSNGSLIQEEDLRAVNELHLSSNEYEVETAIPSGKPVTLSGKVEQYFYQADFLHYTGYYELPVTAKTTYKLVWEDEESHEENVTITEFYEVRREFSYWKLSEVRLYYLDTCLVKNEAFQADEPVLLKNDKIPELTCVMNQEEYLKLPQTTIELSGGTLDGGSNRPYLSYGKMQEKVERTVGEIEVNNDGFSIDGDCYLKEGWSKKETSAPTYLMEQRPVTFTKEKLLIPKGVTNGFYDTDIITKYRLINSKAEKEYEIEKTNGIKVHTPVVCAGSISDERAWNQQVNPTAYPSLILGRTFSVTLSSKGKHIDAKGYGTQDYSEFVKEYQVYFPFAVIQGKQYFEKETWIPVKKGETVFTLPENVLEGDYQIWYRTLAYNAKESASMQWNANLDPDYDAAAVRLDAAVVGRLFDFQITNVVDYPRWQSVFWKSGTTEPSGITYFAGTNDLNGKKRREPNSLYLCPILKGSHPYRKNAGPVGLGYRVEFSLTSVGTSPGKEKGMRLSPTFYHITKEGTNRQRVRLYQKDTLEEITLPFTWEGANDVVAAKAGQSSVQKENLSQDIVLAQKEEMPQDIVLAQKEEVSQGIVLAQNENVLHDMDSDTELYYNSAHKSNTWQKWNGTCRIEPDIYIVPADIDLKAYLRKKGGRADTKDGIFLQGGYLIVNTDFTLLKGSSPYLNYRNPQNAKNGYCDMWKTEGFFTMRVDGEGTTFFFEEGDTFVFDLENTISSDYQSFGTH